MRTMTIARRGADVSAPDPWLCRGCGVVHGWGDPQRATQRRVFVTVTDYDDEPPPPPLRGSGVVTTQHLALSCSWHADAAVAAEVLRVHRQRVWSARLPAFYPSESRAEVAT